MIKNIPILFSKNEITINCQFFNFEIPIRPIPISSGIGEAIINAPITGASQAKYGVLISFASSDPPNLLKTGFSSRNTPSLKKRNII